MDITTKEETFICFFRDNELVAIEAQNGHIQRWSTEEMTRAKSRELFGVDRVHSPSNDN